MDNLLSMPSYQNRRRPAHQLALAQPGCILSPRDAFDLSSQLKTFHIRAGAANDNAARLAEFLNAAIQGKALPGGKTPSVIYPGLPSHPNHELAQVLMAGGFGAIVTIDLCSEAAATEFIDSIESNGIACRLTLGDMETTVLPVGTVFFDRFEDCPGMLRVSVGIEPFKDLEATFGEALSKIGLK
jgi:cystathionine beta-lyase/cystathionine gamma-synthase